MTDRPTPSRSTSQTSVMPAWMVAIAGWILPGLGYILIRQKVRGLTVAITIIALFVMGLWIGGMKVVSTPPGGLISGWRGVIANNPWFIAQILTGPMSLIVGSVSKDPVFATSHAHSWDIGTLYTSIAGMLNLLTIIDSAYRANKLEAKR